MGSISGNLKGLGSLFNRSNLSLISLRGGREAPATQRELPDRHDYEDIEELEDNLDSLAIASPAEQLDDIIGPSPAPSESSDDDLSGLAAHTEVQDSQNAPSISRDILPPLGFSENLSEAWSDFNCMPLTDKSLHIADSPVGGDLPANHKVDAIPSVNDPDTPGKLIHFTSRSKV